MRLSLLYDANCSLCVRSSNKVAAWSQDIEVLALQDPECRRRFPQITFAAAKQAVHVVREDGAVFIGALAWAQLAQRGPLPYRFMAACFKLPGATPLAERVYKWVAARRGELP